MEGSGVFTADDSMHFLKFAFVALFLILNISEVYALNTGDCGTPEVMTQKFRAEGQHAFASAERVDRKDNLNTLFGMIFTVNADKSIGYIAQSDKATGQPASKICVYARLADMRIYDARKPGVPAAAQLRATEQDAMQRCNELIKSGRIEAGTCGTLNSTLSRGEPRGEHVMFQGFNVEKQPDGNYKKDGTLVTVTGTLAKGPSTPSDAPFMGLVSGILFSSLPDGATTINTILIFAEYTPYGLSFIE